MKTLIPVLAFACLFSPLRAQKSPVEFGKVPMEDMRMVVYAPDSTAEAVVLEDYGEAYIQLSGVSSNMTFERHVRIKILKKEGTRWADAIIPLYKVGSVEENVTKLKGATYNLENGRVVESRLSKEGIFKEKFNRNMIHQKFTLPDVKEGSVIEYAYKISSEFLVNFPNWTFQRKIPTRYSEYWAIIPEFLTFQKYMQGYVPATGYETKDLNLAGYRAKGHHYISTNVPAFREEPHMTSENDYISKINFALSHINVPGQPVLEIMGSWEKLNTLLLADDDFYGVIKGSGFLKSTVADITKDIADPIGKITTIHNYVKSSIEWDGQKDFYAGAVRKILELKKGTSGDINLILASMLEKAGFDVDMVLLSTRDHGFIREQFPMVRQFNYAVCLVRLPDRSIFLDATAKYLPIGVLPEWCNNGKGLVISNSHFGWVSLDTKAKSKTLVSADFNMSETGLLKGKLIFTRDGYDANKMRNALQTMGQDAYVQDFIGSRAWSVGGSEFENIAEITKPAKEKYDLEIQDHATVAGDNIYFSPFITMQMETNPYKSENRVYPVDYGSPIENIYFCKFTAPPGFVVDEAPQSKVLVLHDNAARYIYNVAASPGGDWISITSNLQINRNIFTQEDYLDLREFYNQVVFKQAEQIVFKKKL